MDSWRLEYQIKLARLLQQAGRSEEAVRKAETVYRYAEQEEQIAAARRLLAELNALPRADNGQASPPQKLSNVEIVTVPIGTVNMRLLSELREALQQKLGIRFSIAGYSLIPGSADRNLADEYLEKAIDKIRACMPKQVWNRLLAEIGLTEESLDDHGTRVRFLKTILQKDGCPPAKIYAFDELVSKLAAKSQYDAERLLPALARARVPASRSGVIGYLGITEADIFARDYNFLYGWGKRGNGLMSYHRYTAAFNEEPPNRPRLLERSTKQGISSTFFILGIPRCTAPACARAYPHTLVEHDQKTCDLCEECKQALARVKAENGATARK